MLVFIACMNVQRLVCATMSFRTPDVSSDATRRKRPCPHACTARPNHCLDVLSPALEPPGCRSGPESTFLVGSVVTLSLSLIANRSSSIDASLTTANARCHLILKSDYRTYPWRERNCPKAVSPDKQKSTILSACNSKPGAFGHVSHVLRSTDQLANHATDPPSRLTR